MCNFGKHRCNFYSKNTNFISPLIYQTSWAIYSLYLFIVLSLIYSFLLVTKASKYFLLYFSFTSSVLTITNICQYQLSRWLRSRIQCCLYHKECFSFSYCFLEPNLLLCILLFIVGMFGIVNLDLHAARRPRIPVSCFKPFIFRSEF